MRKFGGRGKATASALARRATRGRRLRRIRHLIDAGLPAEMRTALEYLVTGRADPAAQAVAERAEERRSEIASSEGTIPIITSPKPGSSGETAVEGLRPEPGEVKYFSMAKIATAGKHRRWGTTLYLVARDFGCTSGIELGACTGISAMYLASAPTMVAFTTVEGSSALSEIASESLGGFPAVSVVNSLFDDALDSELPRLAGQIDFAFIDGHHEKVATIHYVDRLEPAFHDGAVVVFDDISWSADMRQAWDLLRVRDQWSHAIDLGVIGICIYRSDSSGTPPPRQWDLQAIVGRKPIPELGKY